MKYSNLIIALVLCLGSTLSLQSQTVPSYVPTNGLLGYWPFNGNADDVSGNGYHGTVYGATLSNDRNANAASAYSFNGTGNYIAAPNILPLNGSTELTISVWARIMGPNTNTNCSSGCFQSIIHRGMESSPGYFRVGLGQSSFNFVAAVTPTSVASTATYPLPQPIWHHIVISYNGITEKLYIDGILSNTSFNSTPIGNSVDSIRFGRFFTTTPGFPYYTNGFIDDIGIWNRALTSCEVSGLFQQTSFAILTQPVSQTVNINNSAQFFVNYSSPGVLYQWQTDFGFGFQNLNSTGQYSGTTTDTLTISNTTMVNNNQAFRCIISASSCSDTTDVAILTINNNVGINEINSQSLYSIYPNPTSDKIKIKADLSLIGLGYTIYNQKGQAIVTGILKSENSEIDLRSLSNGVYLIRIGNYSKKTFQLIK